MVLKCKPKGRRKQTRHMLRIPSVSEKIHSRGQRLLDSRVQANYDGNPVRFRMRRRYLLTLTQGCDFPMPGQTQIPAKVAAILVYARPVLVFGGMLCALSVMWSRNPIIYTLGVSLLFLSMSLDMVDGWFSARFRPHAPLAPLADRLMDKLVYSIIFPVIAVGMMWRLVVLAADPTRGQLLHAIFVLMLCVTVLIRDNFAAFMRGFAIRAGVEPEKSEYNRLRTIVAAPVSALLYAHAFYVPEGPPSQIYFWISWLGNIPLRVLLFIEILFWSSTWAPLPATAVNTAPPVWMNFVSATRFSGARSCRSSPTP